MKLAIVQAAPVFLDKEGTTEKIIRKMRESAAMGAEICLFPETFLPGYPVWVFLKNCSVFGDEAHQYVYGQYLQSAVYMDGPEIRAVVKTAKELNLMVELGVAERVHANQTIYCTMIIIHPEFGIVNVHRKLIATLTERTVWGRGDGAGLKTVAFSDWKIGGLNCWENWMPLSRFTLYAQGETLHIASWPGDSMLSGDITKFIAMEGRMYAASVGGILRPEDIPRDFILRKELLEEDKRLLDGGSCLYGPNGEEVIPLTSGKEEILYADLDIKTVLSARRYFDPAGHYNEPSVFHLTVNNERLSPVLFTDGMQTSV